MSEALGRSRGYWATGEKGTIQIVLFITTFAATALNLSNTATFFIDVAKGAILLIGIGYLIGYARYTVHLSKKEIVAPVILATIFGLSSTVVPSVLALVGEAGL